MKRKHLISIVMLMVLAAVWYGYGVYNEGPRDLKEEKADVGISAEELLQAYLVDEVLANNMYLDKVISVRGKVQEIRDGVVSTIIFETSDPMSTIVCELANKEDKKGIEIGQEVNVKGQCTGFLSDVIMVKCIIE